MTRSEKDPVEELRDHWEVVDPNPGMKQIATGALLIAFVAMIVIGVAIGKGM